MSASPQQLLKILIGVAWIDGQVSAVEQQHLQQVTQELGLTTDPEISILLENIGKEAIAPELCYQWVQDFLGDRPSLDNYQQLLDALSGIVYSDNDVATEEAQLLTNLEALNPSAKKLSPAQSILDKLRSAYQQWVPR